MTIRFTTLVNYIPYAGESWGAAWGNVDSSSLAPELWTVNHQSPATLYELRPNRARDITQSVFGDSIRGDLHGSAWGDFDNDGDQDLIQQVASDFGGSVTQFYENQHDRLLEQARFRGLDQPLKGRNPLWLDYNRDGRLDLWVNGPTGNGVGPTLFQQNVRGRFDNVNAPSGLRLRSTRYAQLSDLTGDGVPEILIDGGKEIYQTGTHGQLVNRTAQILGGSQINGARDAITADFNNDLQPDLWITRRGGTSQTQQVNNRELRSYWDTSGSTTNVGTEFQTNGQVTFTLPMYDASLIFIGGQQVSATDNTFTLSPNDAWLQGGTTAPRRGNGVYINYNRNSRTWSIQLVGRDAPPTYGFVQSTQRIQSWSTLGFRSALLLD